MKRFIPGIIIFWLFYGLASAESLTVERIIDGSTLELSNGEEVRLIGVDASNMEPEATDFLKNIVGDWRQVELRLEYDVQKKDQKGRTLAYVYLYQCELGCMIDADVGFAFYELDDGLYLFLNETMIATGHARSMAVPPNVKFAESFERLYLAAKAQKRGLWAEPANQLDALMDIDSFGGSSNKKSSKGLTNYLDNGMINIKTPF